MKIIALEIDLVEKPRNYKYKAWQKLNLILL
jgi:hypothetical protein